MSPLQRCFEAVAFGVSDLLTSRKLLIFQERHPALYWLMAAPIIVIPIAAVAFAFAWLDGIVRF